MIEKLEAMETRFQVLEAKVVDPEIITNGPLFAKLMRERGGLEKPIAAYRDYKQACALLDESQAAIANPDEDSELRDMLREDIPDQKKNKEKTLHHLIGIMATEDKDSSRDCIVEIRSGTGGNEASLFVADLYRMYTNYASTKKWKIEVLTLSEGEIGVKEVSFSVKGKTAYKTLQFEGGTHRVQRVPETETKGRIHTSAATVAVLPEVEEIEIEINLDDLRIDTYGASGAGGQHVNKTASAVRLTHLPTNIVVACQDERSQHKNKARAMRILRSRLYDKFEIEKKAKEDSLRRSMVGSGDRSEKIRTYNFPQSRVTDHRINQSFFNLQEILQGGLEEVTTAVLNYYKTEKLKQFQLNDN